MSYNQIPAQRQHDDVSTRELGTVYHDLRQCVTAGLLLSQMPHDDLLDGETRRRFSLIQQTLSHAADLLESATTASTPPSRPVDLSALAQACAAVAEFGHKVRFVSDVASPPLVTGDPVLLHRAVDNMIDNAGRAAGADGDVVVRVGTEADRAWVEVVDDGPGFGEIHHGTGRGLSVVSTAARSCGGRLEIESGPGPGTTVRMSFPLRTAPSPRRTP
jgi:signal transduction histidine kinase